MRNAIRRILNGSAPFVLLDTAKPDPRNRSSLLFHGPIDIYKTRNLSEVPALLEAIEKAGQRHYLAGYIAYEAAFALEERLRPLSNGLRSFPADLVWFAAFPKPIAINPMEFRALASPGQRIGSARPLLSTPRFALTQQEYARRVTRIREQIVEGETYQVNFTFDAWVRSTLSSTELYLKLRDGQRTPYCALLCTGSRDLLSFSPELFFRKTGRLVEVKPMKGTAPRGRSVEEDERLAVALSADPKNRAENVMIVDLLRNDLGRVCEPGSIDTVKLFEIEQHPSLFQMTSTVRGRLRPECGFSALIKNLFPCGSVTGAPKIRTMEIIHALEKGLRGVYCGAIGYLSPQGKAVFNVPIRTLQRSKGKRTWQYRIGSGVVWDSDADSEWKECLLKARFLAQDKERDFELFESLLFKNGNFLYLKEHTARLSVSAERLGFAFDAKEYGRVLKKIRQRIKRKTSFKIRLRLNQQGLFQFDADSLVTPVEPFSDKLMLSEKRVDPDNLFLYHKTTRREWYEEAMRLFRAHCCYDMLFLNMHGEVTEGARNNIFIQQGNRLFTPPLCCGLLPGILRGRLLRSGKCREKILTLQDVRNAQAVYMGNSVRGLVRVRPDF